MCRKCTGLAPVSTKQFASVKVCPECYDYIWNDYCNLRLFPLEMLHLAKPNLLSQLITKPGFALQNTLMSAWNLDDTEVGEDVMNASNELKSLFSENPFDDSIRIIYEGDRAERPRDLFKPPKNKNFRRVKQPLANEGNKGEEKIILASGKVFLKTKKGEVVRWARFDSNYCLNFYEAEFVSLNTTTNQ